MNFIKKTVISVLFLGAFAPTHGMWKSFLTKAALNKKTLFAAAATASAGAGYALSGGKLTHKINSTFGPKQLIAHDFDSPLPSDLISEIQEKSYKYYESTEPVSCEPVNKDVWLIKRNKDLDRITGAKRFADIINTYQFDEITLPKKYSYTSNTGKKYVIAEHLKGSYGLITLKQVKQLEGLVKISQWLDASFHRENLMRIESGKIAIVDTEPYLDTLPFSLAFDKSKLTRIKNPYDNVIMLLEELDGSSTPPAQSYITKKLIHYKKLQTSPLYAQEYQQKKALKPYWQLLKSPLFSHA